MEDSKEDGVAETPTEISKKGKGRAKRGLKSSQSSSEGGDGNQKA